LRKVFFISLFLTALIASGFCGFEFSRGVGAQTEANGTIRVGERLTYNISFDKFPNVAYAETNVISRGKVAGKEAFEVRSKFKTLNYLSFGALFEDVDRTTYISPADGSVLLVKNIDNITGAPVETSINFLEKSPGGFDLTAIVFKIRSSGGVGAF